MLWSDVIIVLIMVAGAVIAAITNHENLASTLAGAAAGFMTRSGRTHPYTEAERKDLGDVNNRIRARE